MGLIARVHRYTAQEVADAMTSKMPLAPVPSGSPTVGGRVSSDDSGGTLGGGGGYEEFVEEEQPSNAFTALSCMFPMCCETRKTEVSARPAQPTARAAQAQQTRGGALTLSPDSMEDT